MKHSRHTFGADAVCAGVSLPALQRLMGHADVQTTMRYVHLSPADVWREYDRAVAAKTAPSSTICAAIEKRNRLGLITSRRCVLGEIRFSSYAKRRMVRLMVPSRE